MGAAPILPSRGLCRSQAPLSLQKGSSASENPDRCPGQCPGVCGLGGRLLAWAVGTKRRAFSLPGMDGSFQSLLHFSECPNFHYKSVQTRRKVGELHISHHASAQCPLRLYFTLLCFITTSPPPARQPLGFSRSFPSKVQMLGHRTPKHFTGVSPTVFVWGSFLFEAKSPSEMHASHVHYAVSFDKSGHVSPNHCVRL